MDLSAAEFGYFVTQVAMSAASFGVATSDLTIVGTALQNTFGYKDSAPMVVIPSQPADLQAICVGDGCPMAANSTMSGYTSVAEPSTAVASLVPSMSSATGTPTPAMSMAPTTTMGSGAASTGAGSGGATSTPVSTNAGALMGFNLLAVAAGFAVFLL